MPTNLFISTMRTVTPLAVALALSWTGRLGIPVDSEAAASAVALGLAAVYYLAFRGLEWLAERLSWGPLRIAAGVLLGWARPPAYGGTAQKTSVRVVVGEAEGREFLAALKRATDGGKSQSAGNGS
ncbi:hypothetical protein JHN59_13860 [Streptomyces sp. MBT49]|uniref:hypothetical protein n=1 Tax=Streptomyces sp. MBT49 TaxID=1488380 RepID=UPI00190A04A0|nr:hypothetical protein [Streptomyces sp. MBT49]MBK3625909.1 hypothetical protein [Streptomyces sp. MBT49]